MKKRLFALIAALLTIGLLAGCGSDEAAVLKDMKVERHVKLGEYKGMEASAKLPEVTDKELKDAVNNQCMYFVTEENGITDAKVKDGDLVNLDYVGKLNGTAFEGGSAEGYVLEIGSNSFIGGFEEGVIGATPGETFDLDLTFPTDYRNTDLAGKKTVFTVTVNFIIPAVYPDSVVESLGIEGVGTDEELRQYVYDNLFASAQNSYDASIENQIMDAIMENSKYKRLPKAMLEKHSVAVKKSVEEMAAQYGMTPEQLTGLLYRKTLAEFQEYYGEYAAKQSLTLQAIANKENLNISDEELDTLLEAKAKDAGASSVEEYIGDQTREDFRENFMYEKVLAFLKENAVITN